jgi:hypothetical protein
MKRTGGLLSVLVAGLWWFFRELITHALFDRVLHMSAPGNALVWLTQYGPPLLFLGAGLWLFYRSRPLPTRQPEPTMRLEDVVKRIRGTDDVFGPDNSESMKVLQALEAIREKALHGTIAVFGCLYREWRATKPEHWPILVRHPIPPGHWTDHGISYIEFTTDRMGEVRDLANKEAATYIMLWFDAHEIDSVWPRARRRIDWANPIRWKDG